MITELIIAFIVGILFGVITGLCTFESRRKIKNQSFTDKFRTSFTHETYQIPKDFDKNQY